MKIDISTQAGRDRLPPRQEPFWTSLGSRMALGYRTGITGEAGTWIARYRERSGSKKHFKPLGACPTFTAAKKAAEAWFATMSGGIRRTPARGTVRTALAGYVRHLRQIGRRSAALEIGRRFRLTVPHDDHFGDKRLEDLTREDVERWRVRLRKGRQPRSVNRQVRAVAAGLNWAVDEGGHIGNRRAWTLKAYVDEGEEAVFLTKEQRQRLIEAASPLFRAFLLGLSYTGCRPGELARAVVADCDVEGRALSLYHHKGKGAKRRNRAVMLPKESLEFFREQCRDKLPKAPLITGVKGKHWTNDRWCHWMTQAISTANAKAKTPAERIPEGAKAYSFRHARISELLQEKGIDPLTTARQCGTSVAVIEAHYHRFIPAAMLEKLDATEKTSPAKSA